MDQNGPMNQFHIHIYIDIDISKITLTCGTKYCRVITLSQGSFTWGWSLSSCRMPNRSPNRSQSTSWMALKSEWFLSRHLQKKKKKLLEVTALSMFLISLSMSFAFILFLFFLTKPKLLTTNGRNYLWCVRSARPTNRLNETYVLLTERNKCLDVHFDSTLGFYDILKSSEFLSAFIWKKL